MTPAARLSAAMALLDEIGDLKRPASLVMKDWGVRNRYAGAGDRSAIANLVYDALRVRASAAWLMGEATARANLLGMLRRFRGLTLPDIEALFSGARFAPEPLTENERARLEIADLSAAPPHVRGDYPEWLDGAFTRVFGEDRAAELGAMAARAPLDLRVNALKLTRPKALEMLGHLDPEPCPHSPLGLRILPNADGRVPFVQGEPAYVKGAIEIQDEGSQLAALLAGAQPGEQVLDLCAGAGGKTLALAAAMNNKGQIFASDSSPQRLANIHERLQRAGARNVQVRSPRQGAPQLTGLEGRMNLVLVDAPCTGTGTWRRNPDAKWRLRPGSLDERLKEQVEVLDLAALCVAKGGRLVYITCSLLREENGDQLAAFLTRHPDFQPAPPAEMAEAARLPALGVHADASGLGLLLTPLRTGTDGFFIGALRRT